MWPQAWHDQVKAPSPRLLLEEAGEEANVSPMFQLFREFTNGQFRSLFYRVLRTDCLKAWGQCSTVESSVAAGRSLLVGGWGNL